MSRFSIKFLAGCLLLACGVFLGADLAAKSSERARGPLQPKVQVRVPAELQESTLPQPVLPAEGIPTTSNGNRSNVARNRPSAADTLAVPVSDSTIDRIGNKTGDLLQILAYYGVKSVVSLFDGLLK